MQYNERLEAGQEGLRAIVAELMGRVWVEHGDDIPGFNIWEEDKAIEVIRKDQISDTRIITFRVGKKSFNVHFSAAGLMSTNEGIEECSYYDASIDDLMVASGLMLSYYTQAMTV